jgi:hypothetical protein
LLGAGAGAPWATPPAKPKADIASTQAATVPEDSRTHGLVCVTVAIS